MFNTNQEQDKNKATSLFGGNPLFGGSAGDGKGGSLFGGSGTGGSLFGGNTGNTPSLFSNINPPPLSTQPQASQPSSGGGPSLFSNISTKK